MRPIRPDRSILLFSSFSLAFSACSPQLVGEVPESLLTGPLPRVVLIAGDAQSATAGNLLPQSVVARIEDSGGQPVAGVAAAFTITVGSGSRTVLQGTSLADGTVSAQWTLGTGAGSQKLQVSASGYAPATFVATAMPGAAAKLSVVGPNSVATDACSSVIKVTRTDAYDNAVASGSASTLTLGGQTANGGFYAASDCSGGSSTSLVILSGQSSANVYFKSSATGGYSLTADFAGLAQGALGVAVYTPSMRVELDPQAADSPAVLELGYMSLNGSGYEAIVSAAEGTRVEGGFERLVNGDTSEVFELTFTDDGLRVGESESIRFDRGESRQPFSIRVPPHRGVLRLALSP